MGSSMKPSIFTDRVANALRKWHRTAKKNVRRARQVARSSPGTPSGPTSPVHLLRRHAGGPVSPRTPGTPSGPTSPVHLLWRHAGGPAQSPPRSEGSGSLALRIDIPAPRDFSFDKNRDGT